jgi:hypothetical protein
MVKSKLLALVCQCGDPNVIADRDSMTGATIVECTVCGRMVGGFSEEEAVRMWKAITEMLGKSPTVPSAV